MKTTEAVKGRWSEVFAAYGLPAINHMKHVDCPICGKSKKFRIDDKDGSGSYICVCGAGNGWSLLELTQGKDFRTLAAEIDQIIGNRPEYEKSEPVQNTKLDKALLQFRTGSKIAESPVELYLNNRGVFTMPKGGAVFAPNVYSTDTRLNYDGMFALASNEFGEAVYSHITYLRDGQKANVDTVRKMQTLQEYAGSVAIKLFEARSTLGIAEGIETALSCHQLYKLPVWSTINATLMKKFKAPSGVNRLMIFADNDSNGTGLAAAFECGNKNILRNNDVTSVSIRWPKCEDFNDMLTNPSEVFEWELTR
jgi:putative DNA primase/helicase